MAAHRLVTVTGAGGAAKTRLALQAAAEVVDRYPDGVWWVELAEVTDPVLIAAAVVEAVGVKADVGKQASGVLAERLAAKQLLVVLDNCEHLVAGVAHLVDRLLRRAGGVAVLATSREPLEVAGKVAWRIPPLAVPRAGGPTSPIVGLSQFDGVRLFVDRARQVRPNFHLSDDNGPAVAGICERLDGIPLALELASRPLPVAQPAQILDGLAEGYHQRRIRPPRPSDNRPRTQWPLTLTAHHEGAPSSREFHSLPVLVQSFNVRCVCSGSHMLVFSSLT